MSHKLSDAYGVLAREYAEKAKRLEKARALAERDELVDEFVAMIVNLSGKEDCLCGGKLVRRYTISEGTLWLITESFKQEGR